jgi:hypothetical protein
MDKRIKLATYTNVYSGAVRERSHKKTSYFYVTKNGKVNTASARPLFIGLCCCIDNVVTRAITLPYLCLYILYINARRDNTVQGA